jgi:aryl-phospho-beta-D-glucosidase BglC (GH1 family)
MSALAYERVRLRRASSAPLLLLALTLVLIAAPDLSSAQPSRFLSVAGTWIVNPSGHHVILRGVNYAGYETLDPERHNSYAYSRFASLGFNVVRLPISWQNLEPNPGYLDMSQYNWADRFGGHGAPEWSVAQYPPAEGGMREAISNFWVNVTLQEHLAKVWTEIAKQYANETAIAGYDIFNEPTVYIYNSQGANASSVTNLYVKFVNDIRSVDRNHIIFLEPANTKIHKFPIKENIVWSPHFYTLSFSAKYYHENATALAAELSQDYQTFVVEMQAPMWIGEFGAFMRDNSRINWLRDATSLFEKYQVGWAWWAVENGGPLVPSVLCQ